jgi:hypothetical protein
MKNAFTTRVPARPKNLPTIPAAHRAREDGVQRTLLDFLRHQLDADENGDDHAEQGYGGEAEIDDDQLFDVDGDLADQDCRAGKQQGEGDQVIEHAVADGFAKSVKGDMGDTVAQAILPAVVPELCSFSTK